LRAHAFIVLAAPFRRHAWRAEQGPPTRRGCRRTSAGRSDDRYLPMVLRPCARSTGRRLT
jgi:hypothetical protein